MGPRRGADRNDAAAALALFEAHQEWAIKVGRWSVRKLPKFARPHGEVDNAALVGCWRAAQLFDAGRKLKFKTYAYRRIFGAVVDMLRSYEVIQVRAQKRWKKNKWAIPLLTSLEKPREQDRNGTHTLSLRELLSDERSGAGFAAVDAADEVTPLLKQLTAQERFVVIRLGIHGIAMKAIGTELGLSESRICQIWKQAKGKLQRGVRNSE